MAPRPIASAAVHRPKRSKITKKAPIAYTISPVPALIGVEAGGEAPVAEEAGGVMEGELEEHTGSGGGRGDVIEGGGGGGGMLPALVGARGGWGGKGVSRVVRRDVKGERDMRCTVNKKVRIKRALREPFYSYGDCGDDVISARTNRFVTFLSCGYAVRCTAIPGPLFTSIMCPASL